MDYKTVNGLFLNLTLSLFLLEITKLKSLTFITLFIFYIKIQIRLVITVP